MVQLSNIIALASVTISSALAAPLRGSFFNAEPEHRILLAPEVPFGGDAAIITYHIEENPTPQESFLSAFRESHMPFNGFEAGLPMESMYEKPMEHAGSPFVFSNSRFSGEKSLSDRISSMFGLLRLSESSLALSGPTRVIFAREDSPDNAHKEVKKDEKEKEHKIHKWWRHTKKKVNNWWKKTKKNVGSWWFKLLHGGKTREQIEAQKKGKDSKEKKPTSTTTNSSATGSATATSSSSDSAATPTPAAGASSAKTAESSGPAAPQAGQSAEGSPAPEPTSAS